MTERRDDSDIVKKLLELQEFFVRELDAYGSYVTMVSEKVQLLTKIFLCC